MNSALRGGGEELESQEVLEPDATLAPPADPTITALELRGEEEVLTGGSWEILYYNQTDEQWRERPYGKDSLGRYGCGPVCLSMAVSSKTSSPSTSTTRVFMVASLMETLSQTPAGAEQYQARDGVPSFITFD